MTADAKSKRANVVFTIELARRLAGTAMTAVAVHPGAALTNLQQHTSGALTRRLIPLLARVAMGSPEGAAWPSLYAATSPNVRNGAFVGPAGRHQDAGRPLRPACRAAPTTRLKAPHAGQTASTAPASSSPSGVPPPTMDNSIKFIFFETFENRHTYMQTAVGALQLSFFSYRKEVVP